MYPEMGQSFPYIGRYGSMGHPPTLLPVNEEPPHDHQTKRSGRWRYWPARRRGYARVGADANIAALRRDFSEVRWHRFADWVREFDGAPLNVRLRTPEIATPIIGQ
jgi:hypothetical protein